MLLGAAVIVGPAVGGRRLEAAGDMPAHVVDRCPGAVEDMMPAVRDKHPAVVDRHPGAARGVPAVEGMPHLVAVDGALRDWYWCRWVEEYPR